MAVAARVEPLERLDCLPQVAPDGGLGRAGGLGELEELPAVHELRDEVVVLRVLEHGQLAHEVTVVRCAVGAAFAEVLVDGQRERRVRGDLGSANRLVCRDGVLAELLWQR